MNEDVSVRFGASTAALDSAVGRIRGTLSGLSSSFSGIFTGGGANSLNSLNAAMGGLTSGASGASAALGPVGVGIAAVTAASVAATGTLLSLAGQFGDMAEKLDQTSQKLGMTTADVMRWNAVAGMAGISTQSMAMSLTRLERAMATAAGGSKRTSGAFQQLGLDVKSVKNPTEAVLQIADKFKTMPDGPQKIALAMQTMGRAGAQLIPVLNGGREALLEQMKMAEDYGVVMDDAFVQKGLAVDDAMDRMNMGMDGIRNVLYDSLAPAMQSTVEGFNELIKSFITSYKEGGVVKDIMDGVALTFDVLGTVGSVVFDALSAIVEAFGSVFSAVFDAVSMIFSGTISEQKSGMGIWEVLFKGVITIIQVFAMDFRIMGSVVSGIVRALVTTFVGLSEILRNVFTFDFAGAIDTFNRWKSQMTAIAVKTGTDVVTTFQNTKKKVEDTWSKPIKSEIKLGGGAKKATQDLDLSNIPQAGGKTGKKGKGDSEANKKAKEELEAYLEALKGKMDAAKDNNEELMRLEDEKIARVKAFYGEDSKEYRAALNEKAEMQRKHQKELNDLTKDGIDHRVDLERITADADADLAAVRLDVERDRIAQQAEMGAISRQQELAANAQLAQQEYADQVAHENRMYNLDKQALLDKLALMGIEEAEKRKLNQQLEVLEAQHSARTRMAEARNSQQNAAQQNAAWMEKHKIQLGMISSLSQSWGNALAQMAVGQATFADTVKAMWQGIVGAVMQAIAGMIANWIAQQLMALIFGKAMKAATAGPQIMANAAVAASGAYAATAMIPIIGPGLAPAAAATALAGAMSFLPLAMASKGFDVPSGVNPLTQLHEQEMVLPKNLANPLRAMLKSPRSSPLAGDAASAGYNAANNNGGYSGGDVHYHDHTERGMTPSQIVNNREALAKAMKMAHREGRFVGAKVLR